MALRLVLMTDDADWIREWSVTTKDRTSEAEKETVYDIRKNVALSMLCDEILGACELAEAKDE